MKKNTKKNKSDRGKVIIFYQSYDFYKKFSEKSHKLFPYSISIKAFKLFFEKFLYQIDLLTYQLIYIEIDPIFCQFDEILKYIEKTKSKKANIFLVTTRIENFYKLENRVFLKNIMPLLWMGEEIIDINGNNYPYPSEKKI